MCSAMFRPNGGLAHGRSGGDDDQFAGLQAAGHVVQFEEAGGHAGEVVAVAVLDLLEGLLQQAGEADRLVGDALLGDGEEALLGLVEDLGDLLAGGVGLVDDLAGGGDQLAQQGLVADDGRVVLGVGGRGDGLGQLDDVLDAADLLQDAAADQFVAEDDQVDGRALVVQVEQGLVEQAVLGLVEAARTCAAG